MSHTFMREARNCDVTVSYSQAYVSRRVVLSIFIPVHFSYMFGAFKSACGYFNYNNNNWNSNEKLKEKFGSCTRKTFDRCTTKDSYTWNITHNMESTAV